MFHKNKTPLAFLVLLQLAYFLQIECGQISSEYSNAGDIDFNQQIMKYLNAFQTKLDSKTLTKMDEQVLVFLLNLIVQRTKAIEKEKENRTVYWHSRQGR